MDWHDWYGDYADGPETNPWGATSGSTRIVRGGFWNGDAWCTRAALRLDGSPNNRFSEDGGRVVRSVP